MSEEYMSKRFALKNYLGNLTEDQLQENERMLREERLESNRLHDLDDLRYFAEKALRAIPNGLDDEGDGENWSSPVRAPLTRLLLNIESMKTKEKEMTQEQETPITAFGEINVKKGDILFVHVEVGRMPPSRIPQYIQRCKEALDKRMVEPFKEKGIEIVFIPMREAVPTMAFSTIRQDDSEPEAETLIVSAELTEAIEATNG